MPHNQLVPAEVASLLLRKIYDVALAFAWGKVCFSTWDTTLEIAGERILRYSRWPSELQHLLTALYPAYFVFSGARMLTGPEAAKRGGQHYTLLLAAACLAALVLGRRSGRKQSAGS